MRGRCAVIDLGAIKARAAARLAAAALPAPFAEGANPANWLTPPPPISQLATLANNGATDADACCWPHSDGMNGAELLRMSIRLRLFARRGMEEAGAERLADQLMRLDRDRSGLIACVACSRLSGGAAQGWRCNGYRAAGIARELLDDLVATPQRCPGFKASTI